MYFKHKDAKPEISPNTFQNLDAGKKLWNGLFNESYADWLPEPQFNRLNTLFQRRHLLQHTEGIVDKKYLDNYI